MLRAPAPGPDVRLQGIQERKDRTNRYIVRWKVGHRNFSKGFDKKQLATNYLTDLNNARRDGMKFSDATGLPEVWVSSKLSIADWCYQWFRFKYPNWAPKSRVAAAQSLGAVLPLMLRKGAPEPPAGISLAIQRWLADEQPQPDLLVRWSMQFADMNPKTCQQIQSKLPQIMVADRKARRTTPGAMKRIAVSDVKRHHRVINAAFNHAVRQEMILKNPWPPLDPSRMKVLQQNEVISTRGLPTPIEVEELVEAMRNKQPQSVGYQLLVRCIYYLGLRPSEALALHVENFDLPEEGWGKLYLTEAVIEASSRWMKDADPIGAPKTGAREVPVPPHLVANIKEWVGDRRTGLLVSTAKGTHVSINNLERAFRRVADENGWRLYDLRHACATLWLKAGLDAAQVATRLGHSPEVLWRVYAGSMTSDEQYFNEKISQKLDEFFSDAAAN